MRTASSEYFQALLSIGLSNIEKLRNRFSHVQEMERQRPSPIKTVEHVLYYTNSNYYLLSEHESKPFSIKRLVWRCYATDFKRAKWLTTHAAAIIDLANTLLSLQFQNFVLYTLPTSSS